MNMFSISKSSSSSLSSDIDYVDGVNESTKEDDGSGVFPVGDSGYDMNKWHEVGWSPELSLYVANETLGNETSFMTSPDGVGWTVATQEQQFNILKTRLAKEKKKTTKMVWFWDDNNDDVLKRASDLNAEPLELIKFEESRSTQRTLRLLIKFEESRSTQRTLRLLIKFEESRSTQRTLRLVMYGFLAVGLAFGANRIMNDNSQSDRGFY